MNGTFWNGLVIGMTHSGSWSCSPLRSPGQIKKETSCLNSLELNWISEMRIGKVVRKTSINIISHHGAIQLWLKGLRSHPLLEAGRLLVMGTLVFLGFLCQSLLWARQHQFCSYSDLMTRISALSSHELQFSGIHKPPAAFPCFGLLVFSYRAGFLFSMRTLMWVCPHHLFQDHLQISFCLTSVRILLF